MSYIHTKNCGDIPNPHTFTPHMTYVHGLTPEERQQIQSKMTTEDTKYDKPKKGRPDLGCDSGLETQCYCMLARFKGHITVHPQTLNLGKGLIYTPDLKIVCPAQEADKTPFYYVETHAVKNEDEDYRPVPPDDPTSTRAIPADVLARLSCLCKEHGARILYIKPNCYFEIIAMYQGEPYRYREGESALVYCTHCGNVFPDFFPYHDSCPFCTSPDIKHLIYGDGTASGCLSIGGHRYRSAVDLFKDLGEYHATTPVRGEVCDQMEWLDIYGDPPRRAR